MSKKGYKVQPRRAGKTLTLYRDTHRLYGHNAFVREARKNFKPAPNATLADFISSICSSLNCKEQ